jgi:Fe-S oxidoreductase
VLGFDAERRLLEQRLQLDVRMPDTGCCGMAGSFGFEAPKYDVSIACGERVLLPAVRAAGADTLVIADGYSCREQIDQCTGREVLHVAQVLERAIPG